MDRTDKSKTDPLSYVAYSIWFKVFNYVQLKITLKRTNSGDICCQEFLAIKKMHKH